MLQVGSVFFRDKYVGDLIRKDEDFIFKYDKSYLEDKDSTPISFSLPLRTAPFISDQLFPFFEGLLAEGWLRKIQEKEQKIDRNNSFELLIKNGQDLIGAVKVIEK